MIVYVCPQCGSGKIRGMSKALLMASENVVKCVACGWSGPQTDVMVSEIKIDSEGVLTDKQAITEAVVDDFIDMAMAHVSHPLLTAILRSGLLGPDEDKELIVNAVVHGTKGAVSGVLKYLQQEAGKRIGDAKAVRGDGGDYN